MELLGFVDIYIYSNIALLLFVASVAFQYVAYKDKISEHSLHHLVSHGYMVVFVLFSINIFYFYGNAFPLLFSALYNLFGG